MAHRDHDEEWDAIWEHGCRVYYGYAAYARRIRDRPIPIFVLTTPDQDHPT